MLKKLILIVVILAVIILAGFYFGRNIIIEKAVEEGGKYALKVDTDLGSANLAIGAGSFTMDDYEISNPEGYSAKNFLVIKKGFLDVSEGSVFEDELVVDSLILDGITMNFEQIDKKGNYAELLNNVKSISVESSSDSETKLKIKKVAIRDIEVNASLSLLGKAQYDKSLKVDNITLNNVGGSDGASIGEVTARIFKEVIGKASAKVTGSFPDFGQKLDELKNDARDKVETEAKEKLDNLGKSLLKGN